MDQNPNNNPPSDVPAPDANPVVPPPQGGTPPPPSPADPVSSPADPFPSPSGWVSNPGLPVQPAAFGAGSQSPSPAGAPTWATSQPASNPLPVDPPAAGPSDFGGASEFGTVDPVPTFTPPAPETSTDSQPLPTFTPPVPGGDSLATASAPAAGQPDAGLPPAEPSAPQFPPTWPPAPSATGSFDMGAIPEPDQSGEAGPTDLSHLMGSSASGEIVSPQPVPAATTLGLSQPAQYQNSTGPAGSEAPANSQPTDPNPGASQVVTSAPSGGFPKWMLLVGVVVLLVIVAASAYFILGVGSSGQEQTSLPAEQAPLTNPPRALLPTPTMAIPASSTPSASFGDLQGSAPQPSTPSGQSGASALELLRQRQGR